MQSFCQETEFALTDDVHNKLKKQHHNHHHNRLNSHIAGGYHVQGSAATTTTAQGGSGGEGVGPSPAASHNSSSSTAQHQELEQLLNSTGSTSSSTANYYGHSFSGATPTIPASSKAIKGGAAAAASGESNDRKVIAAERRVSLCSTTPGRVKFNSIDNESLKESGGGGGGSAGILAATGGQGTSEGRKSSSGVSPSKKLKKSATSSSSSTSSGTKPSDAGGVPAAAVLKEKGANVGYNIFAKLRELYIELKAETSPQKQSMNLLSTSFLLDKLVSREKLNTLVLNLYPGNKGYSLAFKVVAGSLSLAGHDGGSLAGNLGTGSGSSSSRHRLQSGGAVPNTINSSPSCSSSNMNHVTSLNMNSPSSSGGASSSAAASDQWHLHETMRWPYEEEELLACIDNEELPLMFIDLFERKCPQLFYTGCVIVEVRDYRQSFPISTSCDKFHVLLRPTNQTLLADVQALTSEGEWSHEEKMALESQLILATAEPLCLDPSPQVGINSINGQHGRRMFNSMPIRRHAKKFSQVAINRKRKTDQFTHHFGLELYDFMSRHRQKPRLSLGSNASGSGGGAAASLSSGGRDAGPTTPTTSLSAFAARVKRVEVQPVRPPSLNLPETLTVPSGEVNVEMFAKAFERPRETKDCMPQLVEEYVLETDRGNGRVNFIKLSILQRPSNSEYLGMLYLDRDYKEDERNGEACQFSLGTRAHANRYIQQFTEIFTEEGRKKVKITHMVPGQQPRVTCTTGLWEQQQQQQQNQQQPSTPTTAGTPQPQIQLPPPTSTPTPGGGGGIVSITTTTTGNLGSGLEEQSVATLGPQGQLLLSKTPQFSFQVHPQGHLAAASNLGINKLVAIQQQQHHQQQQKPATPNAAATVTLASPTAVPVQQQQGQQQSLSHQQTAQLLGNSQIKLLSNLGPNQFIGFTTGPMTQQSMDGQGTAQLQQQSPGGGGGGQPIQYAAIMNCDNNLLKNAISGHSQLGIRNGSLVLLQQNQPGKASAVSLVQTSTGHTVTTGSGTTQMHVTLPQGLTQSGRPLLQAGGVPVLQAQLVGVPINQQQQQLQSQQSPAQSQQQAAVVMSPPPPQVPVLQSGGVPQQQQQHPHHHNQTQQQQQQHHHQQQNMVQQTQAQLSTKQQNMHATNPAINALFSSILASANQFEKQQAAAAAAAAASSCTTPTGGQQPTGKVSATSGGSSSSICNSGSSNSTIINLLNSAPAAMTNKSGTGSATATTNPTTPGPPTLVNAFSGLVSPPPSSASSSSQYGNSPATPVTGTTNNAGASTTEAENIHHGQQQHSKSLTKQQRIDRLLLNGGNDSPRLSSPSPSEGSGPENNSQSMQQQQQSVRVTMSALASQLASPPAIMTNSIIQANKHLAEGRGGGAAQGNVKLNVTQGGGAGGSVAGQVVYGLNGLHQVATVVQQQQQQQQTRLSSSNNGHPISSPTPPPLGAQGGQGQGGRREILANIMSPGSDSNHSTASSFSLSMPTLNNLLAAGSSSGNNMREASVCGPGSVGASSNGGNSMPPSPSPSLVPLPVLGANKGPSQQQQQVGNILTIHASPGGGGGVGSGCLISNSAVGSSSSSNSCAGSNHSVAVLNNNNSMLIDRLTAMTNSSAGNSGNLNPNSHGMVTMVNSSNTSAASLLQSLQSQSSHFLSNAAIPPTAAVAPMNKVTVNNSQHVMSNPSHIPQQSQQQQQQFTIPSASPKASTTTVLQNIQLQASPVVGGNVSPQAGNVGGATLMQTQPSGATTTLNLQGLNLASLQGAMATIPGLQNVQVQIPGLPHTISLSLSNNPGGAPSVTANSQQGAGLLVSVPVSATNSVQSGGGSSVQQMTTSGQQTVVLTNAGGGQSLPFAQYVTSAAGLKGLGQQQHMVATTTMAGGVGSQGTPIQLVGLQMNPGSRNITATVSSASNQQQTTTILNATSKLPMHRLSCPQLVRTLSSTGNATTTLKLTQTGGLQVQSANAATGGIFVNQSPGMNSILMTSQQLQAFQNQKQQQAVAAMVSQQQQQQQQQQPQLQVAQQLSTGGAVIGGVVGSNVPGGAQGPAIVAKAMTKHGK